MMRTLRLVREFPLPVRLLFVNQFGVNLAFYILMPYLATHLAQDLGLSLAVVGVVLGVRNLSQQGLDLIGGSAADRFGARGVIIIGCGLRAVGFGLFALGGSIPLLLSAAVLSGVAGALFNPAVRAYVTVETGAERRAAAFALLLVFAQAGTLLGPALGAALLLIEFRAVALAAGLVFVVLTIVQWAALPGRPVPRHSNSVVADWRECATNRRFLAFTLALSGLFALQAQLYLVLPLEAARLTGTASSVAVLFVLSCVVTMAGQVRVTSYFSAAMPRGRALACGMAIMGAGFTVPALSHLVPAAGTGLGPTAFLLRLLPVLTAATLLAFGVMIVQPFVLELIPAFGRPHVAGTYFGVFYLVSGVVATVSTAAVGWVSELGGWLAALLCAVIGLACAAGVTLLDRRGALPPVSARAEAGS